MKKQIIPVLIGVGLVVGVFGTSAVKSHLDTVSDGIRETARNAVPAEYEINRIRSLIDAMSEDVAGFQDKLGEIESTVNAKREETRRLEALIAEDLRDLVAEKNMLAREGDEFTVRGVSYRREQVEASAKARMDRVKRHQSTRGLLAKAIVPLERDVADGRRRLADAASARDDKLRELDLLTAELKNAELRGDLAALTRPLKDDAINRSRGELAESLDAFSRRVRREQRRVDSVTNNASPALIEHMNPSRPGVMDELESFLSTQQVEIQEAQPARPE
jgi:predicted  nucleic acid-binding Zn-ribbon protein